MNVEVNKDGTLKELPPLLRTLNALGTVGVVAVIPARIQWTYDTYKASKARRFPVSQTLEIYNYLTGESYVNIVDRLHQYGIPTQTLSSYFELWPNARGIGLRFRFLVPAAQVAMADDILRQYAGFTYTVDSPQHGRGYAYGQPWGVPARPRSWDEMVSGFIFSASTGRSALTIKAKGKKTPLQKPEGQRPRMAATRRKATRKQPRKHTALKRAAKAVWNA